MQLVHTPPHAPRASSPSHTIPVVLSPGTPKGPGPLKFIYDIDEKTYTISDMVSLVCVCVCTISDMVSLVCVCVCVLCCAWGRRIGKMGVWF